MYPSSSSGIGIPSPFGLPPSSVHGGGNVAVAADDSCVPGPTFSWLNQFGGQSLGVLTGSGDPQPGLKMPTGGGSGGGGGGDQMIDRSSYLNSLDSHTAGLPRLTPHSIVSSGSSSLTLETHGQQSSDGGTFHPYRPGSNGGAGGGGVPISHPSISSSQYAAYDSIYKAYQNAYGAGSAAAMFGNQPYRYDNSLLAAEHQLMLQTSLLQYPHLGIYQNPAALYPNLQSGIRYQGDYYLQNLAGLSLLSKYPDITGSSWPGMDRSPAFSSEREKDVKEYDRCKDAQDATKRRSSSEKETLSSSLLVDRHRSRHDRGEESRRDEASAAAKRDDAARHRSEKEGPKNEQTKRSSSTRHEQRHSDAMYSKFNSGRHGEYTFTSRTHGSGGIVTSVAAGEPLNLQKPLSSPCGTMQQQQQQQRQTSTRRDRTFEMNPEYTGMKNRHQVASSSSKGDEFRDKRGTTTSVPNQPSKFGSSTMMNSFGQQQQQQQQHFKGQFETKFHRPFEHQVQSTTASLTFAKDSSERYDRHQQFGIHGIARDVQHHPSNSSSNSKGGDGSQDHCSRADYVDYGKAVAHHEKPQQHHPQQHFHQQQQQLMSRSSSDRRLLLNSSSVGKKRTGESNSQNDELPLNLALTKAAHFDPGLLPTSKERDSSAVRTSVLVRDPNVGNCDQKRSSSSGVVVVPANSSSSSSRSVKSSKDSTRSKAAAERKPLVSKLDLMIARKKKKKAKGDDGEKKDEKSDEENDDDRLLADDDSLEVAKRLLITSGPNLVDDVSSKKMQFLAMFGLMSVDVHKDFEYKQQRRRRRQLRECSVSPIQLNNSSTEPTSAAALFGSIDERGYDDCVDKELMLHLLQSVVNSDAECHSEYGQNSSKILSIDVAHSMKRHFKHRTERSNSTTPPSPTTCRKRCHVEDDRVAAAMTRDRFVTTDESRLSTSSAERRCFVDACRAFENVKNVRSQRKFNSLASDHLGEGRDHKDIKHDTKDPGFNEVDVIATEGSRSLVKMNRCSSSSTSPSDRMIHDLDSDPVYIWPGHEVIIESYYHHMEEQTMEKQLLIEQNNRLHLLNTDLIQKSDQLRGQVSDLLQTKEQLSNSRFKIQSAIDDLKTCIKFLK